MRTPLSRTIAAAVLLVAAPAAQENLELGKMWTFENPPLAYLKAEYGFSPTQQWLDALRLASLRYGNGCSASFVSPRGLIMTNHHCTRDNIAAVQGDKDWLTNGFYARSLDEEVKVPDLTVQQLVAMRDVSTAMDEGIQSGDLEDEIARKRRLNEAKIIEAAKAEHPDRQAQVVKLYQGAIHQLYLYKVWDDIRLVCAPHLQTAHFGGDPDNFTFPRYSIDFAFCRAWENGKPADTSAHYFRWNSDGVRDQELVFVTGNPGTTKRLLTYAQLEYMRDAYHPMVNETIDHRLEIRKRLAASEPEREKDLRTEILSLENAQKAFRGYYAGLVDESMMAQKAKAETAFKAKVMADPQARDRFGAAWSRLAKVAQTRTQTEAVRRFQTTAGHPVLGRAVAIVNAVDDSTPEALRGRLRDQAARPLKGGPLDPLGRADFIDHLERARRWLPEGDPWLKAVLGDRTPDAVARMLDESRLYDEAFLAEVLEGGRSAVASSDEPALVMARAISPLIDANRKQNDELTAVEDAQGALIGQALHAVYGTSVSPDATFTPRFSDGVIAGYPCNGTLAPHRTVFHGLYARNLEFGNQYPFNLPKVWVDRQDRIDLSKSVNVVSTNDIIGGNSGSPLVNSDLEVVGLVFDGNIEMLPNRYLYRSDLPRSVSVHADAIMEALQKIYEADRVAEELREGATPAKPTQR
jgi:hypothetical protein